MAWKITSFEGDDGVVPGDVFEDSLDSSPDPNVRKLLDKLARNVEYAAEQGPTGEGGGRFEKCHSYPFWQIKASRGNKRGRHFFCWDHSRHRLVLLSGVVKEGNTATNGSKYVEAKAQMDRYRQTGRIAEDG